MTLVSRREVLVGAAGTAAAVALAGCSPSGSSNPSGAAPGEPVTLTFWYWAEDDAPGANAWLEETAKKYHELNPNVTIDIVPQDSSVIDTNYQTAAKARSGGPDIASLWCGSRMYTAIWQGEVAPIDDYIPKEEIDHWLSTSETEYEGKVWGVPLFHYGYGIAYNKKMFADAGVTPPADNDQWTWSQLLDACAKLKAKGYVPLGGGNKDGWTGTHLFGFMGIQEMDSLTELLEANVGERNYTDPAVGIIGMYERILETLNPGYWNDDVASLPFQTGLNLLSQEKCAMQFGIDPFVKTWKEALGAENVGVMRHPTWGSGKLNNIDQSTMSVSFFIPEWAPNKQASADFLRYMHDSERMDDWYARTGTPVADDRWDSANITDPELKKMDQWTRRPVQIWAINWLPAQIDDQADVAAGQAIFSGSATPEQAAQMWEDAAAKWRQQQPAQVEQWKKMIASMK